MKPRALNLCLKLPFHPHSLCPLRTLVLSVTAVPNPATSLCSLVPFCPLLLVPGSPSLSSPSGKPPAPPLGSDLGTILSEKPSQPAPPQRVGCFLNDSVAFCSFFIMSASTCFHYLHVSFLHWNAYCFPELSFCPPQCPPLPQSSVDEWNVLCSLVHHFV